MEVGQSETQQLQADWGGGRKEGIGLDLSPREQHTAVAAHNSGLLPRTMTSTGLSMTLENLSAARSL